jgi:hypothetical protein
MQHMTPRQLKEALDVLIEHRQPAMIWGMPGIGKSDIIRQVAHDRGMSLVDKRLAQSDPTELKGFPVPDMQTGTMRFLRDEMLPASNREDAGILFLDELTQAPQAVQAVAYQLVLDRKLGSYELPKNWVVIAAGNRMSDRSISNQMPAALANRFIHLDVSADIDDWMSWASKVGVHPLIRGYLKFRPGNLCVDKIEPAARSFYTPRSWSFVDGIIKKGIADDALMLALLTGAIGEGIAAEVMGYMRDHSSIINVDQIMLNPAKARLPETPGATYAVCAALEDYTTQGNIDRVMEYVVRLEKEFQAVYVSAVSRKPDLEDCQAITQWIIDNRSYLK